MVLRFIPQCLDGPEAFCHQTCTEGCESWTDEHGSENESPGHVMTSNPTCNVVEWLTASGDPIEDMYNGETFAITVTFVPEWTGDGFDWNINKSAYEHS